MSVKHLTTAEFDSAVENSPLSVVDFWATWCGPCRMLAPVIEKLGEEYGEKVLIAKVDVDAEPELARRFGIMSIPTVVFLKNGREVDRKIGLMPEAALEAALKQHL